jgi:hypothetical protein
MSAPSGAAAGYFDAASEVARRAAGKGARTVLYYGVGGRVVALRFANDALVPRLSPALQHLREPPCADPDLVVDLWDSASTGTSMIPPPWRGDELRVCGEIGSFIEQGCYTHYNVYHNALTMFDESGRRALYWIKDARDVPDHETASPLFALFHAWMSRHSLHHVHAAAVGTESAGVLLVGDNGAGKSNTVLACLDSPLRLLGDDRCLVGLSPEPTVHSVYGTAKTHPGDIDRFPFLAERRSQVRYLESGKALYFIEELSQGKMLAGCPLVAILSLRVTGRRETTVTQGSAAAALMTIAPYTTLRWPSAGARTLRTLSEVFRRVPCYQLHLGTDVAAIPRAILEVLAGNHRVAAATGDQRG